MRKASRHLGWAVLALAGCQKTGSEIRVDPARFAASRIAMVDFDRDSSVILRDFPREAFPAHVTPFPGKDWVVAGITIRLFSPEREFIQFDCSIPRDVCLVSGEDIGLETPGFFQFRPGEKLLAWVAECGKKAGRLGSTPAFHFDRERTPALRSRFLEMNVMIGENKLGHTPERLSLGGSFDPKEHSVDSLVKLLKAEGGIFR